jgi:3-oxoacyl-[acyl-carrier-protein] synthase II
MSAGLKDVVITGCGIVSPLGLEPVAVHARLCAGETAAAPITAFDPTPFPSRYGCAIPGFQGKDWVENRKNLKLMTPAVQYGIAAIRLAAQAAGLTPGSVAPERLGMFVGAGTAFGEMGDLVPALEKAMVDGRHDPRRFATEGMPMVNPLWLLKGLSNNVLGYASALLDAQGINQNYCNSGVGALQAVGEAAWAVAEGRADVIIAGASDAALNVEHLTGFGRLGVLSERARSHPFDVRHDGFIVGDGAAFFVLETAAHAAARGATVLARVAGAGNATALRGLSGCDPLAIAAAFRGALRVAEWSTVDVVHAHGNGNPRYDAAEATALAAVFGASGPAVTADKGGLGHSISAAGGLSLAVALQTIRTARIPPVVGLARPIPEAAELDLVVESPREHRVARSLVHCAGLGGQTSVVAIEAP